MKEIAGVNSDTFTILIVDDIALNLLLLDKMLKPFDFQIVKAANGREALETIQSRIGTPGSIDLAIVDLMMPDIDGFKVIEHVRNGCDNAEFRIPAQSKSDLPILILSGMNFGEDIERGLALGANQFITNSSAGSGLRCRSAPAGSRRWGSLPARCPDHPGCARCCPPWA